MGRMAIRPYCKKRGFCLPKGKKGTLLIKINFAKKRFFENFCRIYKYKMIAQAFGQFYLLFK